MVLSRCFELPDMVSATLAGVVTSRDQAELVSFVRATIQVTGSVNLLLVLEEFAGWNPDGRLETGTPWLRDDEGVSRMAIVGDPAWKIGALTLMAQPLRRVPIAYFTSEESARRWLAAGSRAPSPAASP
jgi:hypothetical protein